MTKLRNIGYLRFGSKILQGFAGFLPPSPLRSPSPLCGSRGQKMRAQREGAEFYIWGGSLPPPLPGGRPLPPHHLAAEGRQAPAKDFCAKKIIFIYIKVPTAPCRAVGPLPPPCWAVGV